LHAGPSDSAWNSLPEDIGALPNCHVRIELLKTSLLSSAFTYTDRFPFSFRATSLFAVQYANCKCMMMMMMIVVVVVVVVV